MVEGGPENQLPSQETLVLPKEEAMALMAEPEAMMPRLVLRLEAGLLGEVVGGVEGDASAAAAEVEERDGEGCKLSDDEGAESVASAAAVSVALEAGDSMGNDATEMAPAVGATLGATVGPPPETVTVTTVLEVTVTVAGPQVWGSILCLSSTTGAPVSSAEPAD